MSAALDYLIAARPEACGHYFAFLKDCGKHLDPKTRNLISIITKVNAQTERGFKQYLRRALREGCTPTEVLDALLMAFPTLGLTKITWAADVILSMDLEGFALEQLHQQSKHTNTFSTKPEIHSEEIWYDVVLLTDLPDTTTTHIAFSNLPDAPEMAMKGIFIHRQADVVTAWDARCPHQGTALDANDVLHDANTQAIQIVCPKHDWTFDGKTGHCTQGSATTGHLVQQIIQVQAGWVQIKLTNPSNPISV